MYKKDNLKTYVSKTPLSNICKYYLECLEQEDEIEFDVFANNNLEYIELNVFPCSNNKSVFESQKAQDLFRIIKKEYGKEIFLGYPAILRKYKSYKSGWEGFFVEPILFFAVEINDKLPVIKREIPTFNSSVLKRFTKHGMEKAIDELLNLEEDLELNIEDKIPKFDELVLRLHKIRPNWPWKEEIAPDRLITAPPIKDIKEEGIYNRAILIIGKRSKFTNGLKSELKSLTELKTDVYENTALGQWINSNIDRTNTDEKRSLIEVLPLNTEQRQAIEHSLANPLTIITGPPGTGKSQVVTNLLINAAWQGKKILFASKNNKAVDVVEIRVNNLDKRPILLRMGNVQYNAKLAEYLMDILKSPYSEQDKKEFDLNNKRYKQLESRFLELEEEEKALITLRNETDRLDRAARKISKEISTNAFNELKTADSKKINAAAGIFKKALFKARKDKQNFLEKLLWNLLKKNRYKKLQKQIEKICLITSRFEIDIPNKTVCKDTLQYWIDFSETLDKYLYFLETIQNYTFSLRDLQKAKPLEQISKEKISLMKEMADNAAVLWRGWLSLLPAGLSKEKREMLSSYITLLKIVIDAGNANLYDTLGKNQYVQYLNLSEKVSGFLPALAVTSLSAKKIPFMPALFDIVVFDEASQCDIASALPLLYRAKQAVVIGDPKQLRHISGMPKGHDLSLLKKYDLIPNYAQWAYSYNSLFDLTAGLVSKNDIINLKDHHRSHSEIIEFSNQEFYKGILRVNTNYDRLKFPYQDKKGVRWVNVNGTVTRPIKNGIQKGAVNKTEAEMVVKEIEKLVNERDYKGSIGVVTPFNAQAELINKIINNNTSIKNRLQNNDFIADTVHKFQGDEKDLILFSTVVSKNMPYGALWFMQNNGNLFNVAITRAKAMLIVVGDLDAAIKCKISYLENFAKYTKELEKKTREQIDISLKDMGPEYPKVNCPENVSDWERILYKALYKAGIKTIPQYKIEKYILDLALFVGDKCLDIEVDGKRYHSDWTGELCIRDQIRNKRLLELGWDVKRFWVYEIRDDLALCVEKIKKWIENNMQLLQNC